MFHSSSPKNKKGQVASNWCLFLKHMGIAIYLESFIAIKNLNLGKEHQSVTQMLQSIIVMIVKLRLLLETVLYVIIKY